MVFDRHITKTVDADGDGLQAAETLHFVYDGLHVWADFNEDGSIAVRYLHGDRIDEIIARFRPSEGTAWYLTDALGTIRDIADASGAVINHIDYDSFGNVVSETNPAAGDRYKFTGREHDAETGLYYYRARYYDPTTGRFITQDPIGFAGGDANLYRYVGNTPTTFIDPLGLTDVGETGAIKSQIIARDAQAIAMLGCLSKGIITHVAKAIAGKGWGLAPLNAGTLIASCYAKAQKAANAAVAAEGGDGNDPPGGPGGNGADAQGPGGDREPAPPQRPIDGDRPQHGTSRHDATAFNQAKEWEQAPETEDARFNQDLVDADGNRIPQFRPDAQRIRELPNGQKVVDVLEVQSPGQSENFMDNKIENIKKHLGEDAGDVWWKEPDLGATRN